MAYVFLRGVGTGGGRGEKGVPARIAPGRCLGGILLCAFGELLSKEGGGDGGQAGDPALDVVPVVIGAVVRAWMEVRWAAGVWDDVRWSSAERKAIAQERQVKDMTRSV